uniref:Uncharacterized protein n=1 Tax=Chroomonas placoidea TaxID=173977 RepID=A0A2P1G808_9CRYP|nr:hypothetical protein CplaMt_p019 [Chroomonas placoidea]AVM81098.1 hypothetical protein CplaMt_p019 [Chroomonas placoidea]
MILQTNKKPNLDVVINKSYVFLVGVQLNLEKKDI